MSSLRRRSGRLHRLGLEGIAALSDGHERFEGRDDPAPQALLGVGGKRRGTRAAWRSARPVASCSGSASRRASAVATPSSSAAERSPSAVGDPPGGRGQGTLGVFAAQQLAGQARREVGFRAPPLGLQRSRAGELGDRARG